MSKVSIPLVRGDKIDNGVSYSDALPVNMFAHLSPVFGEPGYMECWPGLSKFSDVLGTDRAAIYNERLEKHLRLSGAYLCEVLPDGTHVTLGQVGGLRQGTLQHFYSFNTQGIISGGNFYLYDPVNGLRGVEDPDIGEPIDGVWVDGYYFMTDGEYLFHTTLVDEAKLDPLMYATAEFSPDPTLGVAKTQENMVIVFGRYSTEYFSNVANDNFAFTRIAGRAQKIGIVSTHAKCEVAKGWVIIGSHKGESLGVYIIGVGTAAKISTSTVERILGKYTEAELVNIRLEYRMDSSGGFVLFHLPNETIYVNLELLTKQGVDNAWGRVKTGDTDESYRGINGIFDSKIGKWVFGDKKEAQVGILDDSLFTQYDERQEWYLYSPFLAIEGASVDQIELETIAGAGVVDRDATVAVATTYNGMTYSVETWQMYGDLYDYNQRFILRMLGYVRNYIGFRFRGNTKSRMTFNSMKIYYE